MNSKLHNFKLYINMLPDKINFYPIRLTSKIIRDLPSRFQIKIFFLILVSVLNGLLELISIGAVLPFLQIIVNPSELLDLGFIKFFLVNFKLDNLEEIQLFITSFFIITIFLTVISRLWGLFLQERLVALIGNNISKKVFSNFLNKPYQFHIKENSNKLVTVVSSQIDICVVAISSFLQLITSLILSIFLLTGIFLISFKSAILCFLIFIFSYFLLGIFTRKRLSRNSKLISEYSRFKFKNLQESIGSLRDIILYNSQNIFENLHSGFDLKVRKSVAEIKFITIAPRYIFEGIGILTIIFFASFLTSNSSNNFSALPILGGIALAAQKLLPTFQKIFSMWSGIISSTSSIEDVSNLLKNNYKKINYRNSETKIDFSKEICLKNIFFNYEKNSNTLVDINLRIKKGEKLGIIGLTGSGKSTLIDLIMGLLSPDKGILSIDGNDLYNKNKIYNMISWQSSIALVPQNIFLADKTIYENIAFGIPKKAISMEKVKSSANKAQISDFIESTKEGYNTLVGERGVRLSGGQLQRIAIARAIYKDAEVIVFDEATNSLDPKTEKKLLKEIFVENDDLTIIFVTHRHSTISLCSKFIELEKGRIIFEGSPDKLSK